ncbi:MAG: hypothetical protein QOK26_4079 [Pseudonocardiales bacterium]|nr:hypothetical protein [Pseudonocardiales bacterium]
MQRYRCPRCGANAYSSAGALTVGTCPKCSAPLAGTQGDVPDAHDVSRHRRYMRTARSRATA